MKGIGAFLMSGCGFLLADVSSDPWLKAVSSLGAVGVLAWYAWYTNTVTLPRKDEKLSDAHVHCETRIEKLAKDFKEECKTEREAFLASLKEERDVRVTEIKLLTSGRDR